MSEMYNRSIQLYCYSTGPCQYALGKVNLFVLLILAFLILHRTN